MQSLLMLVSFLNQNYDERMILEVTFKLKIHKKEIVNKK